MSPFFDYKDKNMTCFGGVNVSELKMSPDFVSEIWSPYVTQSRVAILSKSEYSRNLALKMAKLSPTKNRQ